MGNKEQGHLAAPSGQVPSAFSEDASRPAMYAAPTEQETPQTGVPQHLHEGDVVQLIPGIVGNPMFAGCFMTVTEPRTWGAQGYVQSLGEDGKPGGQAYYRAKWEEMSCVIGKAEFIVA